MKFVMRRWEQWPNDEIFFDEYNAPIWLTSENTVQGSTMDMRWFWNDYVLQLSVGQFVDTDFHRITRIQ